jgi:hypothetical protein
MPTNPVPTGDMPAGEPGRRRAVRRLTHHIFLFAAVNTGLVIADLLLPGRPFFFYPLLFWGVALIVHAFLVKALYVDPAWAEQRAERLREASYDRKHIDQIADDPQETKPPE